MNNFWLPLAPFAVFFLWLFVFGAQNRLRCPDCGLSAPRFQSPFTKSERQWSQGGFLCPDCGCESDMAGAKVPRGKAPSWGWLCVGFGLPAIVSLYAVVAFLSIRP